MLPPSSELKTLKTTFAVCFGALLVLKIALAISLDLYSDEVFYWQASTRPALAYSDLPFMTALLIGLGSAIDAGNSLAARLPFLVLGSSLPFLIYWIARPLHGRQQALESALLCLCLPLGSFLGLLAVPDVPLIFFGLLAFGFFDRAMRSDSLSHWLATGIFVACGLSTHYRFVLYPAAAILFVVFFSPQRILFRNPRFWLCMVIASIGLGPILWFNLSNQLSSASFYFVDRHPWEFQAGGLLHVFKQAGLVTPPLYGMFLLTLAFLYRKAKAGDRSAALFLSLSLCNILVYLILAPWTDATSTSIHWPLSGYFPLLVFLPGALRAGYDYLRLRYQPTTARRLTLSIPIIGFCGSIAALIGIGSQAFQSQLQPLIGQGVLSNKMAGWEEFGAYTGALLEQEFPQHKPVIVADNYYTAAQVEFSGLSTQGFSLDRDKAVRDGRIAQLELWQLDENGLQAKAGEPLLFISEDSTLSIPAKQEVLGRLCARVDSLAYLGTLSLFAGDKVFSYYGSQEIIDVEQQPLHRAFPCPVPASAWLDSPQADARLSGNVQIEGWAFNEDIGVAAVRLLVDDEFYAETNYGLSRVDVVQARQVQSDPNAPLLGFAYKLDSSLLGNGPHTIGIEIVNRQGTSQRYGERAIHIEN